jgi:hypothetical protein
MFRLLKGGKMAKELSRAKLERALKAALAENAELQNDLESSDRAYWKVEGEKRRLQAKLHQLCAELLSAKWPFCEKLTIAKKINNILDEV